MKSLSTICLCIGLIGLLLNCQKSPVFESEILDSNCWKRTDGKIVFTQLSEVKITSPSKISVFFKLDDDDGKGIPNLTTADFNIYEQTANRTCLQPLSTFEAARAVSQEIQEFTHTTFILLDLSGSVLANFEKELKQATAALVNKLNPTPTNTLNNVGIYWFDGAATIHQLIAPSFDKAQILASINQIDASLSKDNSTNLYGAVKGMSDLANDLLAGNTNIAGVSILLFTDGQDRANRVSKEMAYQAIDNSPTTSSFFTVGLGEEISEADLQKFGKDQFVNIQSIDQLSASFTEIAQAIEAEANSYYLFEYCSPIRGGTDNRLIIEAIHGDKKGYIENGFSAEGFEGGCKI